MLSVYWSIPIYRFILFPKISVIWKIFGCGKKHCFYNGKFINQITRPIVLLIQRIHPWICITWLLRASPTQLSLKLHLEDTKYYLSFKKVSLEVFPIYINSNLKTLFSSLPSPSKILFKNSLPFYIFSCKTTKTVNSTLFFIFSSTFFLFHFLL